MIKNEMIRVCCVCGDEFGRKKCDILSSGLRTHGYCPRCLIMARINLGIEKLNLAKLEIEKI